MRSLCIRDNYRVAAYTPWAGELVERSIWSPIQRPRKHFPIGWQNDRHSCGICVINAIEHAIFNVPLFADENRYKLCVWYFVEAVKYLLNDVGISS